MQHSGKFTILFKPQAACGVMHVEIGCGYEKLPQRIITMTVSLLVASEKCLAVLSLDHTGGCGQNSIRSAKACLEHTADTSKL